MGGKLLDPTFVRAGKFDELRDLAKAYVDRAHGASLA